MFGNKINNVRIIPVTLKIIVVFSIFILISNLTSNYINLIFNRTELLKLMTELLTKDLKDIYSFCNNQHEIFQFDGNLAASLESIEKKGNYELKNSRSVFLGIKPGGRILFHASKVPRVDLFKDRDVLAGMNEKHEKRQIDHGTVYFDYNGQEYFGIYKYNSKWDAFIIRAEELNEFYSDSRRIFRVVSLVILGITLVSAVIGVFILRYILRFINQITSGIIRMLSSQQLSLIDMKYATNDDITFLGMAFNSLSNTVNNLIGIFQKFTNKDIVTKAYREREVKLEGQQKDLTILFSDIKSFTFITETLGTDIIKLLNMHYNRAIREIIKFDGVIGSIIGDALLAVYGAIEDSMENKSLQAVFSGYKIHDVTELLRNQMAEIKNSIEKEKGALTPGELRVYKAVLLEVGVGIDGGEVFYGTLGSYARMTSTVIGDNVNAASRLEGLTRIYKVPMICSEYIKNDIEFNVKEHGIVFVELDTVLVKGKTTGTKIFWPVLEKDFTEKLARNISYYRAGLALYYEGDWKGARGKFGKCRLQVAEIFQERTKSKCPKNWNGIWEMKTK